MWHVVYVICMQRNISSWKGPTLVPPLVVSLPLSGEDRLHTYLNIAMSSWPGPPCSDTSHGLTIAASIPSSIWYLPPCGSPWYPHFWSCSLKGSLLIIYSQMHMFAVCNLLSWSCPTLWSHRERVTSPLFNKICHPFWWASVCHKRPHWPASILPSLLIWWVASASVSPLLWTTSPRWTPTCHSSPHCKTIFSVFSGITQGVYLQSLLETFQMGFQVGMKPQFGRCIHQQATYTAGQLPRRGTLNHPNHWVTHPHPA